MQREAAVRVGVNAAAVGHNHRYKRIRVGGVGIRSVDVRLVQGKIRAVGEQCFGIAVKNRRLPAGRQRRVGRRKIGHVHRLFDMQLPGLAVLQSAVIVHAVGGVGALLHLRQQNALADGMQRARGNKGEISLFDLHVPYRVQQGLLLDTGAELRLCERFFHAEDQLRPRVAIQNVPALGLAELVFVHTGIGIVGMYLHRQFVGGVDEFDQYGKRLGFTVRAQRRFAVFPDDRVQRFSGVLPTGNDGRPRLMAGKHPAFGDIFHIRAAVERFQPLPAPKGGFQRRGQFYRFHKDQSLRINIFYILPRLC